MRSEDAAMDRPKNKWTAAFFLALSVTVVLSAAMLHLGNGRSQAVRAFERDREAFEAAARQALEYGSGTAAACPKGVREVNLYLGSYPYEPTVEFLMGSSGFGSQTRYWGINYVESGRILGFLGTRMEYWKEQGSGTLFYEVEGDNTCYVEPLDESWFYFEMEF